MRPRFLLLLLIFSNHLLAQTQLMKPAISPDGNALAFSYQGDIWVSDIAGENPKRLTIHEAYESDPLWTNDGKSLIFSSNRFGNNDLYKISVNGGIPTRLTYHSAGDSPYSVTPNGDILFTTSRNYRQVEREAEIYVLENDEVTEKRFMDALGFDPVMSPDGKLVAFVRGTCRTAREAYKGPANRDVWVYDMENDTYTNISEHATNDFNPLWLNNNEVIFISGRSGKYNLHKANLNGDVSQLTNRTDFGIQHFSLSASTQKIVYRTVERSYLFDLNSNQTNPLNISIKVFLLFQIMAGKHHTPFSSTKCCLSASLTLSRK
jgi:Tol biopolymer transport system component